MHRNSTPSVDLHGLHPDAALRRLAQALHTARVQGSSKLLVITGRGLGNLAQQPVLRGRVEAWLRGPDGRSLGVKGLDRARGGGALEVHLGLPDART